MTTTEQFLKPRLLRGSWSKIESITNSINTMSYGTRNSSIENADQTKFLSKTYAFK